MPTSSMSQHDPRVTCLAYFDSVLRLHLRVQGSVYNLNASDSDLHIGQEGSHDQDNKREKWLISAFLK